MAPEARRYGGLDPDAAGHRIGELLDALRESLPADDLGRVEELTQLLTAVHGAGLERVLELARALPHGDALETALRTDPLVASLLVVHDLPERAAGRVQPQPVELRRSRAGGT